MSMVGRPDVDTIFHKFVYGGPGTLGPYWEEPGRSIVTSLYRDIIPPGALFKDISRLFFPRYSKSGEREVIVHMPRRMSLEVMRSYTNTWSSYHGWQNAFPDRKSRESGGSGDILDEMFDAMKNATGWDENTEFDVEWESGVLLARKKEF